ncbi:MAG: diaminopimelate decarboxylase [Dehalococcoidia bacterium]|nr:diaminopimelate decarboxylase [Dehalococcoidia bacterium]
MSTAKEVSLLQIFPKTSQIKNNHLFIGGCDCVELADKFGTPLYVFDKTSLLNRCEEFKKEFGSRYPNSLVCYASKAFTNRPLVTILKDTGVGLDVVSGGELSIAQSAGFPPKNVYFHGNNKSEAELKQAVEWGIGRVVVDNFYEISLLEKVASEQGKTQDILLRLSPGIDPHTHRLTSTGVVDSKFGFLMAHAEAAVIAALKAPHLRLLGLHAHLGSPLFDVEPYLEAIPLLLNFAADMKRKHGFRLEEFSPGGGFAITYVRERPAPPISYYAEAITSAIKAQVQKSGLDLPKLTVEPGRAIVGSNAIALYRVGASKDIPGIRKYVSVDGGMGDNIRPPLYEAKYEALVANKASEPVTEKVTLCGKYCESGDILIKDIDLPPLSPGDIIAMPSMGAYSIPMASNYNASLKPAIVLVENGKATLMRRRETYQDLIDKDEF